MVCNMHVVHNQVNVIALFDNYHIVLDCTVLFMYGPLNSNFIDIGYWTLNFLGFVINTQSYTLMLYT